ncbi:MAG: AI-2E family transporter [Vulcanimicrobiaceae bacterium]
MQTALTAVNWRRVLTVLGVVVLAVAALWFAARIPRTMTIFVIAAFIASAARPIVRNLEARKISRGWAIAIIYALLILGAVVSALIILPLTFAQLQVLVANIPSYLQTAQDWTTHIQDVIRSHFPNANLPPQLLDIRHLGSERVNAIFSATLASLGALALNLATALFVVLSALILSFFFLLNDRQLAEGFASLFPARHRETAKALATEIVQVFGGFIAGQVIVSAITGAAIAALTAIFGFKFALLLGLVSALAYAVPIVGMLVAHALGLVVAAPQGIVMVLIVQVVLFVVARISDNVLVPKIMGGSVGVSPIAVMFAVFAGGELFGLPGLILGIPAAALIKLLWRYFVVPWLHGQIEIADTTSPLPEAAEAAQAQAPQQANTPQIQVP